MAPQCSLNPETALEVSGTDDGQQDPEQREEVAALSDTDGDVPGSSASYRILEVRDAFESKLAKLEIYTINDKAKCLLVYLSLLSVCW